MYVADELAFDGAREALVKQDTLGRGASSGLLQSDSPALTRPPKGPVDPQMLKYSAATCPKATGRQGPRDSEPPFGKPVWEFIAKAIAVRR